MSAALKLDLRMSPEEFAIFEAKADVRHEWRDGEIFAMEPDWDGHSLLAGNVCACLSAALENRPLCVHGAGMRIAIPTSGWEVYADASATPWLPCPERASRQTLTDPLLIVEVMSERTEGHDRGMKFRHYRRLPSLREYVLIASAEAQVEVFRRQPDGAWSLRTFEGIETEVRLESLDVTLPMAALYAKTPAAGAVLEGNEDLM